MNNQNLKAVLEELLSDLDDTVYWLKRSFEFCNEVGIKDKYTDEEFDAYENLTSRFSRTTDFLVNKVYRTIDRVEMERSGTLIDVVNRAHKRGIIDSPQTIRQMKELRNEIAHEYVSHDLNPLFKTVLKFTPKLLEYIMLVKKYAENLK